MTLRLALGSVVFAGALMFATSSAVRADDDCQKRTIKADHNLHEAIQKHGPQSSQAEHWRSELAAARNYCWQHEHKWWDQDTQGWHDKQDWDAHDHDH